MILLHINAKHVIGAKISNYDNFALDWVFAVKSTRGALNTALTNNCRARR